MKNFTSAGPLVALNLVILAASIALGAWYAHKEKEDLLITLGDRVEEQHAVLLDLADTTNKNAVDDTVAKIIVDCRERERFEVLLGQLGSLPYRDLLEVQQLFDSCGDFFSVQKGFMVSRMQREEKVLTDIVALYTELKEDTAYPALVTAWNSLVSKELNRSELLAEQVVIQGEIITLLIKGSRVNDTDIRERVQRANEISELLTVLNQQINAERLLLQEA